jgi:glucose-1-phosphate cytidylyltransferase
MKAVILAGGRGSRLSEETHARPKPMVEIGGKPILWHIMKIYEHHGIRDFVICLGYRGEFIKEYFYNYALHQSDVTFSLKTGQTTVHRSDGEDWNVTLIDTGEATETGARIRKILPFVESEEAFCLTYGDGVGDIDITREIAFHKAHGKLATLAAVAPPGRFGALKFDEDGKTVGELIEKPAGDGGLINGGFFVLSPKVREYIADGEGEIWERGPLARLAAAGQLVGYKHAGFWRPMDTIRDRHDLEEMWAGSKPPWKVWG